jgi:hypothetical protein
VSEHWVLDLPSRPLTSALLAGHLSLDALARQESEPDAHLCRSPLVTDALASRLTDATQFPIGLLLAHQEPTPAAAAAVSALKPGVLNRALTCWLESKMWNGKGADRLAYAGHLQVALCSRYLRSMPDLSELDADEVAMLISFESDEELLLANPSLTQGQRLRILAECSPVMALRWARAHLDAPPLELATAFQAMMMNEDFTTEDRATEDAVSSVFSALSRQAAIAVLSHLRAPDITALSGICPAIGQDPAFFAALPLHTALLVASRQALAETMHTALDSAQAWTVFVAAAEANKDASLRDLLDAARVVAQ